MDRGSGDGGGGGGGGGAKGVVQKRRKKKREKKSTKTVRIVSYTRTRSRRNLPILCTLRE